MSVAPVEADSVSAMPVPSRRSWLRDPMVLLILTVLSLYLGVNGVMFWFSLRFGADLVSKDYYARAERYDDQLAAEAANRASGWRTRLSAAPGTVTLAVTDAQGQPVAGLTGTLVTPVPPMRGFVLVAEYTIPRAVIVDAPSAVTLPPSVAPVEVTPVAEGLATSGAAGAIGVTLLDTADGTLLPATFVAITVQVTAVPFVRPVTVIGEAGAETLRAPHFAV